MSEYRVPTKLDKILESMSSEGNKELAPKGCLTADEIREGMNNLREDQVKSEEMLKRIEKKIAERKSRPRKSSLGRVAQSKHRLYTHQPKDTIDAIFASFDLDAL